VNKPKAIGTRAETAVARYLQANGFPHAERRALRGRQDAGDITGTPGVCWEVKGGELARNASDTLVAEWLKDTERERIAADEQTGVLVLQRRQVGPANAGRWWAVLTVDAIRHLVGDPFYNTDHFGQPVRMLLADAVTLLRAAGYGEALEVTGGDD
jgi:hypothetical protein